METIQYSLKNNTDYSIDLRLALKYSQSREHQKSKSKNNLVVQEHKSNRGSCDKDKDSISSGATEDDKNAIFDKPLLDIYGNRTCIFFEISKDVFQLRYLDNTVNTTVNRSEFYIKIPTLVEKLYTVIVVEKIIQDSNNSNMEIVAIHSPPNNTSTVNNIITPSLN